MIKKNKMTEIQEQIFKRLLQAKGNPDKRIIGVELASTIPDDNRPHFNNTSLMDEEGEIWKPIVGFEEFYSISNYGRVKSFYRSIKEGRKGEAKQILQTKFNRGGYLCICLHGNGISSSASIHIQVCKAFGKYIKGMDCHHINGIKLDNRAMNLASTTRSENIQHAWDTGLNKGSVNILGTQRYNAVLTEDLVFKVRTMVSKGIKKRDVMAELGISESRYKMCNKKTAWRHVVI